MAFMGTNNSLELDCDCFSFRLVQTLLSEQHAIEKKDPDEQQRCLVYWAAFGSFTLAETITDKLIYWFPFYYHMKFAFLVWLQLPSTDGATQVYMNHVRPFFLRHQAKLDDIVGFVYDKLLHLQAALAISHEAKFQFVKKVMGSVVAAVNERVNEMMGPVHRGGGRGRGRGRATTKQDQEEDSESEHQD